VDAYFCCITLNFSNTCTDLHWFSFGQLATSLLKVEQKLIETKALPGAWFNHDENFRKSWNDALDLKNQGVAHWWLPVLLNIPDETKFRSMLEHRKSATPGALAHVAKAVAVERKLIKVHIDEVSEDTGETALMRCAAAGDHEGVRILLCASADKRVKDKVGICNLQVDL
jgi:hypothetical protein